MKTFIVKLFYFFALIAGLVGLWVVIASSTGTVGDSNAIYVAAAAGSGIGIAVIPYVIARTIDKLLN